MRRGVWHYRLDAGNVNLVLPWIRESDEAEICRAFADALAVRALGPRAKAMADLYFFETLVRVHRAGEGAPHTGLKPAGRDLGPAIPAADRALQEGSVDTDGVAGRRDPQGPSRALRAHGGAQALRSGRREGGPELRRRVRELCPLGGAAVAGGGAIGRGTS